ncbi:MAG: hypothetical protein ACPGJV_13385 [Bacteriovoracaceae bacterium]
MQSFWTHHKAYLKRKWRSYLLLSLCFHFIVFLYEYYFQEVGFGFLSFIVALMATDIIFLNQTKHPCFHLMAKKSLISCLFFHFALTVCHGVSVERLNMLYLAFVPMVVSFISIRYFQLAHNDKKNFHDSRPYYYAVAIFALIAVVIISFRQELLNRESFLKANFFDTLIFGLYSLGCFYFFAYDSFSKFGKALRLFQKQDDQISSHGPKYQTGQYQKEKIFFHDLINQTHSLKLFVESYRERGEDVPLEKLGLVSSEIEVLQGLLSGHFSKTHKNISGDNKLVSVQYCSYVLENLIETYLPSSRFTGEFKGVDSNGLVPLAHFHRMMTNIIKNIAEQRSHEYSIIMDVVEENLKITFKNPLKIFKVDNGHLSEYLKKSILNTKAPSEVERIDEQKGLGLQSIINSSEAIGGDCRFTIENGEWVTEIQIPLNNQALNSDAA